LLGRQRNLLADAVDDNEIIAETVHFGEFKFHDTLHIGIRKE
jgi:hypothetical protein